jgi:hypothetical protein
MMHGCFNRQISAGFFELVGNARGLRFGDVGEMDASLRNLKKVLFNAEKPIRLGLSSTARKPFNVPRQFNQFRFFLHGYYWLKLKSKVLPASQKPRLHYELRRRLLLNWLFQTRTFRPRTFYLLNHFKWLLLDVNSFS